MSVLANPFARGGLGRGLVAFAVFQAAWFACVGFAAQGRSGLGVAVVAAAVLLHLRMSDQPRAELRLIAFTLAVGFMGELVALQAGWIAYASPGPVAALPPVWILAMWVLFATTLTGPLAWLHGRPLLAAAFGAIGGPLSYAAAARLGACRFADPGVSMVALGVGWALVTPLLLAAARRLVTRRAGAAA